MAPTSPRPRAWLRLAVGAAGLVAVSLLVRAVGLDEVLAVVRPALAWLPLVILIEALRIATDVVATHFALGSRARLVPRSSLVRATLVGQAVLGIAPAPRAVCEATKATLLAPYVGAASAGAMGAINQSATLIAVGVFSIPCAFASWALSGLSTVTLALMVHTVVLVASGLSLRVAARARGASRFLSRRFPKLGRGAEVFVEAGREVDLFAIKPLAATIVGRMLQTAQYAVLALAVGLDPTGVRALAVQGVSMIGSAVGAFVPAQIGAADGAFALAASALDTTVAKAMSISLLAHATRPFWLAVGSLVVVTWRSRPTLAPEAAVAEPAQAEAVAASVTLGG